MTRRWWAVVASSALLVAVGAMLDWVVPIAMGAGLLTLGLLPFLLRLPRTSSWKDISAPTRVVRGTEASLQIGIDVAAGSTRWVSSVSADGDDRVFTRSLLHSESLSWPIGTSRRGLHLVGPSRLKAGDPFGLMHRLATQEPTPVLVVLRVHPVDVRLGRAQTEEEETQERAGSETFHSLREYVPGDPQKLIHWKYSARAGKFMVQRIVGTAVPRLLVVLDVNVRADDRDRAAGVACQHGRAAVLLG